MVRGPMALFGAIIAVGLGPALWLGAQFGHITADPAPKAPVIADAPEGNAPGRAGAAVDEAGLETKLNVVPDNPVNDDDAGRRLVPLSNTPSARPSRSSSAVAKQPRTPSTAPTSSTPSPTLTTTPPTKRTTPPAKPATPPPSSTGPVPEVSTGTPSTPADTPTTDAGTPTDIASAPPATEPEATEPPGGLA